MYEAKYDVIGAPTIATNIVKIFKEEIFADPNQGLVHEAWSVLLKLFPKADVPVFQFSLAQSMSPMEHLQLAYEMNELRNQGVMIIGSGNIIHNILSAINDRKEGTKEIVHEWAINFDNFVTSKIDNGDFKALVNYEKMEKDAKMTEPTPEHFLPLLYVLGSTKR